MQARPVRTLNPNERLSYSNDNIKVFLASTHQALEGDTNELVKSYLIHVIPEKATGNTAFLVNGVPERTAKSIVQICSSEVLPIKEPWNLSDFELGKLRYQVTVADQDADSDDDEQKIEGTTIPPTQASFPTCFDHLSREERDAVFHIRAAAMQDMRNTLGGDISRL